MKFEQWLISKDIDVQSLTKELRAALRQQYEQEQQAATPPEQVLLVLDGADDDQWQRAVWVPA